MFRKYNYFIKSCSLALAVMGPNILVRLISFVSDGIKPKTVAAKARLGWRMKNVWFRLGVLTSDSQQ